MPCDTKIPSDYNARMYTRLSQLCHRRQKSTSRQTSNILRGAVKAWNRCDSRRSKGEYPFK